MTLFDSAELSEGEQLEACCSSKPFTPAQREEQILDHMDQVRLIARRIHERLPVSVNIDDLISAGIIGLISAIDRYDPKLDVKLRTYADYKIRGAILDSLRELDWAPRQQRKRSRLIETAISKLQQRLKRLPKEEEIAAELKISLAEYQSWLTEIQALTIGSIECAGSEDESHDLLKYIADTAQDSPAHILERAELERFLASAIEKMPKVERTVLSLYYYEEMTLREIARVLDLHESRISQLKSQAILRLRSLLRKKWDSGITG